MEGGKGGAEKGDGGVCMCVNSACRVLWRVGGMPQGLQTCLAGTEQTKGIPGPGSCVQRCREVGAGGGAGDLGSRLLGAR